MYNKAADDAPSSLVTGTQWEVGLLWERLLPGPYPGIGHSSCCTYGRTCISAFCIFPHCICGKCRCCWVLVQWVVGTVGQHILTRQRDARRIRRWDNLGCVGMLTHCDHSRSNANIPRPASKGLILQSGVTH